MAFQIFDKWDPDDTAGFNSRYGFDENAGAFKPSGGDFVKYNNSSQAAGNIIDHVFWSPSSQAVYYKDPDSGKYVKANTAGLDVSGDMGSYLSDNQLDKLAVSIANEIKVNRSNKALEVARQSQIVPQGQGLAAIAIPTPDTPDSIQQKEYKKRKMDANALLQKMMTEDPDVTPEEDNTVYYKYGPDEVDLKYYLHNIGSNLQNYLQSQDWSQAQKNAFMNSYNTYKQALQEQLDTNSGRFSTDDSGMILDSQNLLSPDSGMLVMDENGNIYNSYDEISDKKLRKTATEFFPNQEVSNYLSTIGQAIVGSGKTRKSSSKFDGDFDMNKHGFVNYWINKINPAGGNPDIDPYLALDPVSPTGKRERTNRTKYLAHQLSSYLRKIQGSKTNFENSSFKSKDAYIQKVQQAIDNLNNGWDTTDPASLQAIGITPDFYSALMTEQANPLMSDEEVTAEMEKQKAEAASAHIGKLKEVYDNYASQGRFTEKNAIGFIKDSRYDPNTPGAPERIGAALENLGFPVDEASIAQSADTLWEMVKTALREGRTVIQTRNGQKNIQDILTIILPMYLSQFKDSSSNAGVKYLDDPEHDSQYGAILCMKNGKLYYDFIGNVKESQTWQQLKSDFNKNYVNKPDGPKYAWDKLGGVLKKLQEGGSLNSADFDPETLEALQQIEAMSKDTTQQTTQQLDTTNLTPGQALAQSLYGPRQAAAQAKGLSLQRYNQKQRTPNGQPDFFNKDNGQWKTEDYVRLGAIAADIASLVMDPVTGAVTNVGSTATNFLADWADDSVTATEMWKNLGMNLGMDALSIVPIVGDAAGTGSKLVKSVKTIAPKLMYGLTAWGVLGTLKNGSNIMESLGKVMSDDKLTVGDWQNIAQAITAVAGVNGAVKSGVAKKLAKNRALDNDAIGLGLKDKNGNVQDYIFRGDKAKELKQLVAEGDISKVNAKIKDLEGFSDFEINTNLKSTPLRVGLPIGRTTGADGKKSWGVKNPFSVERTMDTFEIFDASKLKGGYASRNLLNTNRQNAVEAQNILGNDYLKTKAEVDALVKAKIDTDTAAAVAATNKRKNLITATQEQINNKTIKDPRNPTATLTQAEAKTIYTDLQNKLNQYNQKYSDLKSKYKVKKNASYDTVKQAILDTEVSGKKYANSQEVESRLSDISTEISVLDSEIAGLEKQLRNGNISDQVTRDLSNRLNTAKTNKGLITLEQNQLKNLNQDLKSAENLARDLGPLAQQELAFQKSLEQYDLDLGTLRDRLKTLKGEQNNRRGKTTTKATQDLLDLINSGPYTVEYAPGRTREVKDIKDIVTNMNLLKKGGRLQFLKEGNILKAQHGVQLKSNNSWHDDVFSGYEQTILDRIAKNPDYYKTINDKQREHYGLYTDANASGDWTKKAYTGKDNSVGNYQTWYNGEDFNTLGITPNFENRYDFNPSTKRTSLDRPGTYKSDNLYSSITDDRRVLGRQGDWSDSQISDFNNKLKKHGLEMKLGEGNYYYMNPLENSTPQNSSTPAPNPVKPTGIDPALLSIPQNLSQRQTAAKGSNKSSKNSPKFGKNLSGILENLPDSMSLLRYHLLNNANKRAAKQALDGEVTYYQSPKTDNVFVYGDNKALADGERAKANLISTGYNHTLTSDGAQQMAFIKDLHLKGQEYVNAGRKQDNEMWRTTQQMDQAQRKENHTNEHMVAEQNKLSAIKTIKNKADIRRALTSQLANDRDIMLQEWTHKIKKNQAEKQALADAATESRIKLAVQNNPNKYGAGLSSQELSVYNKARAGIAPHSMPQSDINLLASANKKMQLAMQNQYYNWKGVPVDAWTEDANKFPKTKSTFTPTLIPLSKDGSKLAIAKIRNKAKNADRFQKSILKQIDSLDKKLDRISRRMYGLPKSEVVKPK